MSSLPVLRHSADEVTVFDPTTGEALDLHEASNGTIALVRMKIRDLEEDLRLAKQTLDGELLQRFDRSAKWTWQGNGLKVSAPSPAPTTEYRADELRGRLEELQADNVIDQDAVDNAVEIVISFKAKPAGIKALLKLGGPAAEAVAECSQSVEKQRRVSVSRA